MATFRVTGPDGSTYEVNAPDDATDEQIMQYVQSNAAQQSQGTTANNQAQSKPYEGWGEYAGDFARSALGQGLGLGFGDEIAAGARSVFGGEKYDDALKSEREAVDRFRDQNPGTALAGEIGAGFLIPGFGAVKAMQAARSLPGWAGFVKGVTTGAKYGAGFGTTAGFGASEGGDGDILDQAANRVGGAVEGAKWGAGFGAAIPVAAAALRPAANAVSSGIGRAVNTVRDDEAAARLYLADRLRQGGVTEADIGRDLQRGQNVAQFNKTTAADLPETIADVSPITQRSLRGIKVGGDADDIIIKTLEGRQAGDIDFSKGAGAQGQFGRVYDSLRKALGVSQTSLRREIDDLSSKRAQEADRRFTAARKNSEAFDLAPLVTAYRMEAQNLVDPKQRRALLQAIELFEPDPIARGAFSSNARAQSQRFGTNNIDRFDKARKALGDMLSTQSVREQGNLKRLLTRLMNDAKDVAAGGNRSSPSINAGYFDALQDYATRSELIDAADVGRAIATGSEEITPQVWGAFSRAEQKIIRKAYLERLRGSSGEKTQGPSTDYTDKLRKPNVQAALRVMLPPRAGVDKVHAPGGNRERLGEIVRRERRMTETNQKVLGNSSTAEKAVDAVDVGRMARVARYIKENGGMLQAAVAGLSEQLEKFGALKGRRADYLARKLLTTDPLEQQVFLEQVRRTYGAARSAKINAALNNTIGAVERSMVPVATTAGRAWAEDGNGPR